MKKKTPIVFSLCLAAFASNAVHAQTSGLYPINFSETQRITSTTRYTNAVTLNSGDGQQTVEVNQRADRMLYIKRLDDCLFAKPGETVTAGFSSVITWMGGYAYIDLDNNGLFDVEYDDNGVIDAKELMTYSLYKKKDSKGNDVPQEPSLTPPSFVIPAGTKPGIYRMRYKVDWDNVDPGGNNGPQNKITTNGGVIVDTRINIHGAKANISLAQGVEAGTLTLADGTALNATPYDFGKAVRVVAHPADGKSLLSIVVKHGYNLNGAQLLNGNKQWEETTVDADAASPNTCLLDGSLLDGDVQLTPVFAKLDISEGGEGYPVGFDKGKKATVANRLNAVSFIVKGGTASTLQLTDADNATVYKDLTGSALGVKAGDVITPSVALSSNDGLSARLFIDLDQNGRFLSAMGEDGAVTSGSELVSYSYYNGHNSNGEAVAAATMAMPAFTLPSSLADGFYRARLVIDSEGICSEGSAQTVANGGHVVDFLMNVHADEVKLSVNGVGGHLVGSANSGVNETTPFGSPVKLVPMAPVDGYKVTEVVVRHGHNLKGAQYLNGNRQWDEYKVSGAANGTEFTIPASAVDGEVEVTARFAADGSEKYSLVFADEFNGADGSLPDATYWHNCTRENPTWKRFTSQTKEGQARTAFIRDGKLVTRCIANDIKDEGNVEMISGAIESSGKVYYQYGRIEGRLRTTPHTGNFPAFWLMPEDNSAGWPTAGEIDLWEQIDEENKTYHTVHTHVTYDLNLARPNSGSAYTDASAYHVIAMEWTPTLLTWYVDGAKAFSYAKSTDQSLLSKGQWPYDKPFYIILNQSVGNGSWAKPCDVNFEYETLFDYVRIYQKEGQIIEKPTVSVNGVPTAAANIDFYACEGGVKLVTPENRMVRIVDLQGRTVYNRIVQGNVFVALPKGVYIIDGKKLMVN